MARIPNSLKVSKLSSAYHFYDPVPKMIEYHANSAFIHRLLPIEKRNTQMYGEFKIVCSKSEVRERADSTT